MKLHQLVIGLAAAALSVYAVKEVEVNSIVRGQIDPEDAGLKAFLFSARDTVSVNIDNGLFQFTNVTPGTYNVLIQGKPPYRNEVRDGVRVVDGEPTDLGKIQMHR